MNIEVDEHGVMMRKLSDGRILSCYQATFGKGSLSIGSRLTYDDTW